MQRPMALSFLLCEQVIVEEGTRSVTPVNCFSLRRLNRFPSEEVVFTVLAQLADGNGDMSMEVAVQRLDDLGDVFRRSYPVQFRDPLLEARFTARVSCSFPIAGYYQVLLLAENECIAIRKLQIRSKEVSS